jgi:putative selenium metabolism hydrolase
MTTPWKRVEPFAHELGPEALAFAQKLLRCKSYSGDEKAAVKLCVEEMKRLGFDGAEIDRAGNAVGFLKGRGEGGRALMLNSHLDTVAVDEGEPWPFPAWEGRMEDGKLWGRGACDAKGPLAGQIFAAAALRKAGAALDASLYVVCAVQEEVGGLGTRAFLHDRKMDACVVGEPSNGFLMLGHRGRVEVEVSFKGRAAHAAQPPKLSGAVNALQPAGKFLTRLSRLSMKRENFFGVSTAAATRIVTAPGSVNVIPSLAKITLDWRNVPSEGVDEILEKVRALAQECLIPDSSVEVALAERRLRSWAGFEEAGPCLRRGFSTQEPQEIIRAASRALRRVHGRPVKASQWRFATDGGDASAGGVLTVGYGEGDEALAHSCREHIGVAELQRGVAGNASLVLALDEALARS